MGHCYGHHDGTLFWPWSEKTLKWVLPWWNIKFCPSADIKNTGGDGEDPNIPIDMFEMSKSGSHQSIEVALDCFVVSRSTEHGIKVLSRGWNRRAFIFWVLEKTKMLQESQKIPKSPPDRRKANQVVSNPLDKLSKNCRDEKLLKTCKGNPLVFLPIAMDPLCDWAQLEPWVIAPNLFIKS